MADFIKVDIFHEYHRYDSQQEKYVGKMITVEVLTIHFKTGNMRVRCYDEGGRPHTFETDAPDLIDEIYAKLGVDF